MLIVVLCAALLLGSAWAVGPHLARTLDAVDRTRTEIDLKLFPGALRTEVLDAHGDIMGILRFDIDRELVRLYEIAPDAIATLLASEDSKFWEHTGVDLRATARALVSNVSAGSISSGGSTITQQIVKLRIVGNERSFNRKIREAVLAARLEETFTKTQILEFYANEIYLGNDAYGLQAAAEIYFGKDANELDVGDMAFLVGLIRSPGVYNGFDQNIDLVKRRRSSVLARTEEEGIITAAQREVFESRPLPQENLSPQRIDEHLSRDYFLDEVTTALLNHPALGRTSEQRFNLVFNGGLSVETTFRPEMKAQMELAIAEELPEKIGTFEVAMATVDPSTGAILALIGGPEFSNLQFNLATQGKRQPGSSFKPYVLATAVEQAGHLPFDTISGRGPCTFPNAPQADYTVHNFGNSAGEIDTITEQTLRSSNCSFVRLGIKVGPEKTAQTASRLMGRSEDDAFLPYLSLALGAQEVTVLEQAVAYSTFINDGTRMEPYYISRIRDRNGEVLYEHVPRGNQILSRTTAEWVTATLAANVRSGTGRRASLDSGQPAAGKTGTSQDFTDAWFVGFTPQYTTAVWMGDPSEKVSMRDIQGRNGTGGWIPARIWGNFMERALADEPIRPLPSAPPRSRSAQYIFLKGDICATVLEAADGTEIGNFEVPCSMVQVNPTTGALLPLPKAICRVEVDTGLGVVRQQWVACREIVAEFVPPVAEEESTDGVVPPVTAEETASGGTGEQQ